MMLGFLAGPAAVVAGLPQNGLQVVTMLWLGGSAGVAGWSWLNTGVRLEHSALVVHGLFRVHRVPWRRLHGVRRDRHHLWLAWDPDIVNQVGPFTPPPGTGPGSRANVSGADAAERWGAIMVRLHQRALAVGGDGSPPTSRPGSVVVAAICYVLAAVVVGWWRLHG
jgi:hypothetical protein